MGQSGRLRLSGAPEIPLHGKPNKTGGLSDSCAEPKNHGANYEQRTGPTYRQIIDLADWDRSVFTNTPGQSGQPRSPHYSDLLPLWAEGEYAPLLFSREAVGKNTRHKLILTP